MTDRTVYVSITGLTLRRPWHVVRFYWHAIWSLRQARRSRGNFAVSVRTIDGVHYTLTVWENAASMRQFLYSGAHRHAIRAFPAIAVGKTFGFEADREPDWSEVPDLLRQHGRDYGP